MMLLLIGLGVWCVLHLLQFLAAPLRLQLLDKLGENGYKGIFSVLILSSIALMVFGWRSIDPVTIYVPPGWGSTATGVLTLVALILFSASEFHNNIKRFIRHPQLIGMVVFSLGHLVSNGENRSLLLFGIFGLWAAVDIVLLNKRDGKWVKPESVSVRRDFFALVIGVVIFTIFLYMHPFIFGVPAHM